MPRIEIESEEHFTELNKWIYGKLSQGKGRFLTASNIPDNHTARIYVIDEEPIVLWSNDQTRFDSAIISESHAKELRKVGVIFEEKPKQPPAYQGESPQTSRRAV